MRVTLIIATRRFLAAVLRFAELLVADHCQYRAQPLVLDNRSLIDLSDLIEGAVGQLNTLVADRQPAVGIVDHRDPLADRRRSLVSRFQDEKDLIILQRQRL